MACWIPLFRLVAFVDPDANNLTWGAERYVERDGETCAGCGAEV
jgi:hypothetical protein